MKNFLLICCGVIILFILYCLNHPIEPYSGCCKPKRSPEVAAVIGPNCSIAKQIPNPGQLGASGSGSFGALINNGRALVTYVNALVSSPQQGCNFFVQSGTCDDTSVSQCQGKPRFIYHQGIPNPNSKCLQNIGISAGNGSNGGLIPGMIQNVGAIVKTPVGIINALKGSSNKGDSTLISTKCTLQTKPVGPANNLVNQTACVPTYNNLDNNDC